MQPFSMSMYIHVCMCVLKMYAYVCASVDWKLLYSEKNSRVTAPNIRQLE